MGRTREASSSSSFRQRQRREQQPVPRRGLGEGPRCSASARGVLAGALEGILFFFLEFFFREREEEKGAREFERRQAKKNVRQHSSVAPAACCFSSRSNNIPNRPTVSCARKLGGLGGCSGLEANVVLRCRRRRWNTESSSSLSSSSSKSTPLRTKGEEASLTKKLSPSSPSSSSGRSHRATPMPAVAPTAMTESLESLRSHEVLLVGAAIETGVESEKQFRRSRGKTMLSFSFPQHKTILLRGRVFRPTLSFHRREGARSARSPCSRARGTGAQVAERGRK